MKLGIVGTGTMGRVLEEYARSEGTFDEIYMIEPTEDKPWPLEKLDLIIDFSHPEAIGSVYDYCRGQGGNIPVVIATTGYDKEHEHIISLLGRICPVVKKSNFSRGIEAMGRIAVHARELVGGSSDICIHEIHHNKKKDAPSGTALNLCGLLGIEEESIPEKVTVHRMGSFCGEHVVYFAMDEEVLEIRHRAFSKRIFAAGALEEGKKLLNV